MKTAIVNLGTILTGDWRAPFAAGDSIVMDEGKIVLVGTAAASEVESCDVVIDADGAVAVPGLIDSHVHVTFGDYTPAPARTVGFLARKLRSRREPRTAITASEVHVPGRPKDPEGVKCAGRGRDEILRALPSGQHACLRRLGDPGSPASRSADFEERLARKGVWLAKAGFGAFDTPSSGMPR